MKRNLFSLALITLLLISASSLFAKDVRYISGHIKNVDDNLITLTNNLAFKANQHVTAISMTPAVFVLEKDRPEGFVYIKGRKIDVTLMKKSGGQFVVPASTQDYFNYTQGTLHQINSLSEKGAMIELDNNHKWFLTDKNENGMIKNWEVGDWVIITKPQHSKDEQVINTRTTEQTRISKAHEVTNLK